MNTVRSAIYVFEEINERDYEKFYLSAEVTPTERLERIKTISKRLENRQRTILISTPVVEAGVDFDFEMVIRDIAPIDSIIQAAGRCNRHGLRSREDSLVYVFDVRDEKNNPFAPKIYGIYLIAKTRQTFSELENKMSREELRFSDLQVCADNGYLNVKIYWKCVGQKDDGMTKWVPFEDINYSVRHTHRRLGMEHHKVIKTTL